MKIPHAIPQTILRTFAPNLDPDEVQKRYEGRLLKSEDVTWDTKVNPSLSQLCLDMIAYEYVFFVKFVEAINEQGLMDHERRFKQWEKDLEIYKKKKMEYDQKMLSKEDDADDDDDAMSRLLMKEPEVVPDTFPDFKPHPEVLDYLDDEDRMFVIEQLDVNSIPLNISVNTIPDDFFWQRAATSRWPQCDEFDHGRCWRRLYMERHVSEMIETFHPLVGDLEKLMKTLDLIGEEVIHFRIENLIPYRHLHEPPPKPLKRIEADNIVYGEEDVGFDKSKLPVVTEQPDDAPKSDTPSPKDENAILLEKLKEDSSHIDMSVVFPKFTNLRIVSLIYEMSEIGLDYEENLCQFTDKDCGYLAKGHVLKLLMPLGIAHCPTIEVFTLNRSKMTGEQCKVLISEGLRHLHNLKSLNLSYNPIGDSGSAAVAKLIAEESHPPKKSLHTLYLCGVKMKNKGGQALAYALTSNSQLTFLNLKVNSLGDRAGKDFGYALVTNKSLLSLTLAANNLTKETCAIFGKMLQHNESIRHLDLSSNPLQKKGGEFLAIAMRANKTLLKLDLRLCDVSPNFECDIGNYLKKNRARVTYFLIDRDDIYPPEKQKEEVEEDEGSLNLDDDLEYSNSLEFEEEEDEEEEEEEA